MAVAAAAAAAIVAAIVAATATAAAAAVALRRQVSTVCRDRTLHRHLLRDRRCPEVSERIEKKKKNKSTKGSKLFSKKPATEAKEYDIPEAEASGGGDLSVAQWKARVPNSTCPPCDESEGSHF